jgi:cytochrome c553
LTYGSHSDGLRESIATDVGGIVKKSVHLVMGLALAGALHQAVAQPADLDAKASNIAVTVCSACHGPGGENTNPMFPNLAAQQAEYIENQLKAFRAHKRSEPDAQHFMWGPSSRVIDEQLISAMARYYASQPAPKGVPGDPALVAKGKKLFQQGSTAHQIPPCASCHGPDAKGNGAFARLAGQHKEYLLKQLGLIQSAIREAPVMHGIVEHLDSDDMQALATYLQSLD